MPFVRAIASNKGRSLKDPWERQGDDGSHEKKNNDLWTWNS